MFPLLTTPFRTLTKGPQTSHPPLTVHPVLCTKSSTESHMLPNALLCCWVLSSSISSPGPDGGGSRLVFGLLGFSQALGVGDGAWCTCFRQILQPLMDSFLPSGKKPLEAKEARRQCWQVATLSLIVTLILSSFRKNFPMDSCQGG